ncbi:chymotrypsinogen A [Ixodes scapularis]|uniref:chymotrypsinogen A n=1 Tax=Ixodes scapularis TaxID=6945 RepID=UPI001A9D3210|nr:chymotrypsinogen A [Ixodes scapularis]
MRVIVLALLLTPSLASWEKDCGRPAVQPALDSGDRLVGGQAALPGSWPWQAFLPVLPGDHCGGALIDDRHVITAAHCAVIPTARNMTVHLGSHQRTVKDDSEVHIAVEDICVHPGFLNDKSAGRTTDIAILRLRQKVNFTETIRPVCLPENGQKVTSGSEIYVTGWGFTKDGVADAPSELHQLMIKAVSNEECHKDVYNQINGSVFCASHDHGSVSGGDSGSPAVQKVNGRWTQLGIVSGEPHMCSGRHLPQVFTQVSSYVTNFVVPYVKHGICPRPGGTQ